MGKGQVLALFKIKQRGQNILRTPQRGLATEAHSLGSRAACLVLFPSRGHVPPPFLCHSQWFPGLPTTAMWTMDNVFIPETCKKEKGTCQTWPHAHLSAISCLWATPDKTVLGLAWHGQDLASLPRVSKQTSFFENTEGNPGEKETLWPVAATCPQVLTVGTFQCVSCKLQTAPWLRE